MTYEEKKAVEWVKNNLKETIKLGQKYGLEEAIKHQTTILNLIEKQQKEIESLKEDNKKKSIVIIEYQDLYEKLVDKIKATIEEIKNECKYCDFTDEFCQELLQNNNCTQGNALKVLHSLLEKE